MPLLHQLRFTLRLPDQHHLRIEHHITHQLLVADPLDRTRGGGGRVGERHRLPHPGMGRQRGLHLTELDAVPADLDLLISTTEIPQLPIRAPGHQIPGAIHPHPRRPERARHKP